MGNFRTDDDYTPVGGGNYPPNPDPGYGGYDNPEIGDYPGRYGAVKKKSIISRILDALGNSGSGAGNSIRNGLTLEGVLIGVYVSAHCIKPFCGFRFPLLCNVFYSTICGYDCCCCFLGIYILQICPTY